MDTLISHIKQDHAGSVNDSHYSTIKQITRKAEALMYNDQECPFCSEGIAKTKSEFFSHVGRHLQEVSLASIPHSAFMEQNAELIDDSDNGNKGSIETDSGGPGVQ